jgi:hypothetical protein
MFEKLATSILNATEFPLGDYKIYFLKDCFSDQELDSFDDIYNSDGKLVSLQEDLPRLQYDEHRDYYVSKLKASPVLDAINTRFNIECNNLAPLWWQDFPGYDIGPHVDNEGVPAAMQIYLPSNAIKKLGTTFKYKDEIINVPYVPNSGYICFDTTKLTHQSTNAVPEGLTRKSFYCIIQNLEMD